MPKGQYVRTPEILAKQSVSFFKKGQPSAFKGRKLSLEARERIRLSAILRPRKPHSEETKAKIRNKNLITQNKPELKEFRRKLFSGSGNPMWLEDRSQFKYPDSFSKELKAFIRERDDHSCRICQTPGGRRGMRLDVHHIDYNKMNVSQENLITLCISHHMMTNHNRNFWKNLLGKLLKPINLDGALA